MKKMRTSRPRRQKQPGLLDAVRLLVDRKAGHRFLLLGSSQILLLRQVRETLAGRATLLELWPLALAEKVEDDTVSPTGLQGIWQNGERALRRMAENAPFAEDARRWRDTADRHVTWGGYPALQPLADEDRKVWLRDFRRTYLERDLADLLAGVRVPGLGRDACRLTLPLSPSRGAREG